MMNDESDIHAYLGRYKTTRHAVHQSDVTGFFSTLEAAKDERPLQAYLEDHPQLLCCYLRSGHGEWVLPQKRLGAEFVPDFVVGCGNSAGFLWHALELESPNAQFVTQEGMTSKQLRKGMAQIEDWRRWLRDNLDYARRPPSAHGLGLTDITPRIAGTVVIGRRAKVTDRFNQLRRTFRDDYSIEVITYDRLAELFDWIVGVVGHKVT